MYWSKKKGSNRGIKALLLAKFLVGLGIGMVLANYFFEYNWALFGWLLIILAVIIGIPVWIKSLK